jgi:hypothetical protein
LLQTKLNFLKENIRYTLLTESETPLPPDGTYRDAPVNGSVTLTGLGPPESPVGMYRLPPEITEKYLNFWKNTFSEVEQHHMFDGSDNVICERKHKYG